jgi:hypothetical protein
MGGGGEWRGYGRVKRIKICYFYMYGGSIKKPPDKFVDVYLCFCKFGNEDGKKWIHSRKNISRGRSEVRPGI